MLLCNWWRRSGPVKVAPDTVPAPAPATLLPAPAAPLPVYGGLPMSDALTELAASIGERLRTGGLWLATAESCTGGGIAEAITRVAGSSTWFERGWVTYSNAAKAADLGVDPALIQAHGAVSEAVARAMAEGARARAHTAWAVAVTGIAGPGGGSPDKPVGTVWLAWASPEGTLAECRHFHGDRDAIRRATVETSLQRLHELLMLAVPERGM